MNIKRFALLTTTCLMIVSGLLYLNQPVKDKYFPRDNTFFKQQQALADGYFEYLKTIRNNRETGTISYEEVNNAYRAADKLPQGSKTLGLEWRFKGPDNVGGRTRAIAVDKDDTTHIIAGGVSGGLWESFDGATTWQAYDPDFRIQNVSCITQASDGTFYVGTGSTFDGGSDFAGPGNDKSTRSQFAGNGLFKLTGNGTSEVIIAPTDSNSYSLYSLINDVTADPNDSKRLLVATDGGLLEIIIDGIGIGSHRVTTLDNSRCYDVEISDDQKVTASFRRGLIAYSTDNGVSFKYRSFPNAGRVDIEIAPSNSNIQYASAALSSGGCLSGVYRTFDAWETFTLMPSTPDFFATGFEPGRCQGFYDQKIKVFPNNPNKLVAGGVGIVVWNQSSIDPAPLEGSWEFYSSTNDFGLGTGNGFRNPSYVHADVHEFVFNPENSNTLYIGSDGGVAVTFNSDDPLPEFSQANLGYNVTQFYDIAVGPNDIVMGGTQDNGSVLLGLDFNTGKSSIRSFGGDGFDQEMFIINPSLGIASIYYGSIWRIQGIGTKFSNSTVNASSMTTGNLLTLCGGEAANFVQCSRVFNTVTAKWESFNHKDTKDSTLLSFKKTTLPPIKAIERLADTNNDNIIDTIWQRLYVESKNSSPNAFGNFQDLEFDLYEVNTDRLLTYNTLKSDLFPVDTVDGEYVNLTKTATNNQPDTIIVSFDTLIISIRDTLVIDSISMSNDTTFKDSTIRSIKFNYITGATETRDFELKETVKWDNVFVVNSDDPADSVQLSVRVESLGGNLFKFTYKEYKFNFLYETEIPDLIQSTVAVTNIQSPTNPSSRDIWISKDILKGGSVNEPRWVLAADVTSQPDGILSNSDIVVAEFSADGNHLFLGTENSEVYRIDNINDIDVSQITNQTRRDFVVNNITRVHKLEDFKVNRNEFRFRAAITGIAIDPNDANNIVITLGNYGLDHHVLRSSNALMPEGNTSTDDVTWEYIDNGLPKAPFYDVMMDKDDPNVLLVATEVGVYATENARAANPDDVMWTEETTGMGRVPAVSLDQMKYGPERGAINEGKVYVGTHGRGVYEIDRLVSLAERVDANSKDSKKNNELKIYPNPVSEIVNVEVNLDQGKSPLFRVYSISGQLMREIPVSNYSNGKNTVQLNLSDLESGSYIIQLINGKDSKTARLIKQ